MKKKWLQLLLSALAASFGIYLEFFHPAMKALICAPFPLNLDRNHDSSPTSDRTSSNQHSLDQEK
jgi:hypothetical protein